MLRDVIGKVLENPVNFKNKTPIPILEVDCHSSYIVIDPKSGSHECIVVKNLVAMLSANRNMYELVIY